MQTPQFIPVATSPEEQAIELALAEAAARGDALLALRVSEREAKPRVQKPVHKLATAR